MVSLNFCFIPISFLFRFMGKDFILVPARKRTQGVFYQTARLTLVSSFLFIYQNRKTGQVALFSLYYSQNQDQKTSTLLLPLGERCQMSTR